MGFAREIVLAAFYGAGSTSDAFILAFTIPDTLLLFISASVAFSYIPMYYRVEEKNKFTRNLISCLLVCGIAFSVVFTAFPQALVRLFAAQINEETFTLAAYFLRYMVWSAPFILLTGIFNAQLEIHGNFFSAGIRSIWRNAVVILGIVLGALSGYNILIAIAPVAGNALCVFLLACACRKHGFIYKPELDSRSGELKQMLFMAASVFLSASVGEINAIIGKNFAASLSAGAISALNYSDKTQGFFVALIGLPLTTALFPHISKLASDGETQVLKNTLTRGVTYLTAIMLPIGVGVAILAPPIVRILFERGAFTATDTATTAACLRMCAVAVITGSISSLLVRDFYALKNAKTPANVSIAAVGVNIATTFVLIKPLGVQGLALAGTLSSAFKTVLLLFLLRKKLGHLGLRNNLPEFIKIGVASLFMGGGVWFAADKLPFMTAGVLNSLLLCGISSMAGAAVYFTLLLCFRSKIAFEASIMFVKFIERKSKRTSYKNLSG